MNMSKKGFTLIELIIILAIVAILVALAVPSFIDTVRKARRSDAMESILDIHLSQERYRVNNPSYASLADLGLVAEGVEELLSPNGHYNIEIDPNNVDATSYTITGTALGDQTNDPCGGFTLAVLAGVISKTAGGDDDRCWKR
jgi:type IV pilus assembly protein PilE